MLPVKIDKGRYRHFKWKLANKYHNGHDFDCPEDTEVFAVTDGEVLFSFRVNGFGSLNPSTPGGVIVIKHRDKTGKVFHALYGHVNRFVKKGDKVAAGDVIGTVAPFTNKGELLPHCHFAIWDHHSDPPYPWGYVAELEYWVDPIQFLKTRI